MPLTLNGISYDKFIENEHGLGQTVTIEKRIYLHLCKDGWANRWMERLRGQVDLSSWLLQLKSKKAFQEDSYTHVQPLSVRCQLKTRLFLDPLIGSFHVFPGLPYWFSTGLVLEFGLHNDFAY